MKPRPTLTPEIATEKITQMVEILKDVGIGNSLTLCVSLAGSLLKTLGDQGKDSKLICEKVCEQLIKWTDNPTENPE
jgi:hypothetical protein